MLTLGIETSCDESSVALVESGREIRANVILSQSIHTRFGGVVPEIASREHIKTIVPVYRQALEQAGVTIADVQLVAATMGPGLIGPLLVGLSFAKGLSWSRDLPFVAVNHMEGHLAANLLARPELDSSHLTLIVSGGHTMLVHVKAFGDYEIIGRTVDDAAGEAFDKVAKILGLGYPGGAAVDKLARDGDPKYVAFPRPMRRETYKFSFSGLKTAVALHVEKLTDTERERHLADIAASFQEALVDVLVEKTVRAARELRVHDVTISGGVAANSRLREQMAQKLAIHRRRLTVPPADLCTDNAAMIAAAGFFRHQRFGPSEYVLDAVPYLPLE
jgi:N6-L-threonylcarbamoyladenine synthase